MIVLWIVLGLIGLLLVLLLAAVIRTLLIQGKQSTYRPDPDPERAESYARKLADMVRYETVSVPGEDQREKFLGFHKVLEELFPLVHREQVPDNLLLAPGPGVEIGRVILRKV